MARPLGPLKCDGFMLCGRPFTVSVERYVTQKYNSEVRVSGNVDFNTRVLRLSLSDADDLLDVFFHEAYHLWLNNTGWSSAEGCLPKSWEDVTNLTGLFVSQIYRENPETLPRLVEILRTRSVSPDPKKKS